MMKAKPFIVVVFCLFMLLMFAGGMISENDLTPDTPPAAQLNFDDIRPLSAPAGSSGSGCYSPYVVQPGDTLSKIACACGLSLSELLAANPNLANPNLIYANQEVRIPSAAQSDGVPDTGGQGEVVSPAEVVAPPTATAVPAPAVTQAPAPAVPTAAVPGEIPGYRVGETLTVEINNLPPQMPILLTFGTSAGSQYPLPNATSDQIGRLKIEITIPSEARPGEQWVLIATTTSIPAKTFTSAPFDIGGAP